MNLPTKRGFARIYYDAPIVFFIDDSMAEYSGTMRNCSVDGMHFCAEKAIPAGTRIKIHVQNREADSTVPVAYDGYYAVVAWCANLPNDDGFGMGVKFLRPETASLRAAFVNSGQDADMESEPEPYLKVADQEMLQ